MSIEWVSSSATLPHDGDCVEFVLDGHQVALDGTYRHQAFQSRWSEYDVQRVRWWRRADATPQHPAAFEPRIPSQATAAPLRAEAGL